MIRSALAAIVASSFAGALLFSACGDSTFSASQTDATAETQAPIGSDGAALDAQPTTNPLCADGGVHTLCDDFDEKTVSGFWTGSTSCVVPGLDTAEWVSEPSSLNADTQTGSCAALHTNVDSGTEFSGAFDLELDKPGIGGAQYFTIEMAVTGRSFYDITFVYDPATSATALYENSSQPDSGDTTNPPKYPISERFDSGVWVPITFRFDFSEGKIFTSFAGLPEVSTHLASLPTADLIHAYTIFLGFSGVNSPGRQEAHYDNLVCDVIP